MVYDLVHVWWCLKKCVILFLCLDSIVFLRIMSLIYCLGRAGMAMDLYVYAVGLHSVTRIRSNTARFHLDIFTGADFIVKVS